MNKDKSKVTFLSFIFTLFAYTSIGVIGAIGLLGKLNKNGGFLVYNYFPIGDHMTFIIEVIFFINLIISVPFFIYFSKL